MEIHLLVENVAQVESTSNDTLIVAGKSWKRLGPFSPSNVSSMPGFACVSYVWGTGRLPNPFDGGPPISDKTLPSLEAAIRSSTVSAFWVDVFSVPITQPARKATLQSMGYIYSVATEVVVALAPERSTALQEMTQSDELKEQTLLGFEHDEWIKSIWTYQEVVNSQKLYFTSTDLANPVVVDGSTFLNRIGYSLDRYKKVRGLNSFDIRTRLPALDVFEDLVADWMVSDYTDRSALQVMSNLDRRRFVERQNYYYSLIGSISQLPSERPSGMYIVDLVNTVMEICEEKNDYSFIFSPTPRCQDPTRLWRPGTEPLRSILPWFSFGSRQPGRHDDRGFWLERVVVLRPQRIEESDTTAPLEWLRKLPIGVSERVNRNPRSVLDQDIPKFLARIGFTGSEEYIETASGAFYPQEQVPAAAESDIVVAVDIFWMFGNPGILKCHVDRSVSYIPGVLVGTVDKSKACDYLLQAHE